MLYKQWNIEKYKNQYMILFIKSDTSYICYNFFTLSKQHYIEYYSLEKNISHLAFTNG